MHVANELHCSVISCRFALSFLSIKSPAPANGVVFSGMRAVSKVCCRGFILHHIVVGIDNWVIASVKFCSVSVEFYCSVENPIQQNNKFAIIFLKDHRSTV